MKLHIGCGEKYLDGFVHVDVMKHDNIDIVTTADDLSMIEDNSVDEIYACHILEHVGRHEVTKYLKEWNRVLKKGGKLRISVPSFEAICEYYTETKDLPKVIGLLYGGQNYEYNYHFMTYDFESLKNYLIESGFDNVKTYEWREFLPEGYDDYSRSYLPHMDFSNGKLMSLNIICEKK